MFWVTNSFNCQSQVLIKFQHLLRHTFPKAEGVRNRKEEIKVLPSVLWPPGDLINKMNLSTSSATHDITKSSHFFSFITAFLAAFLSRSIGKTMPLVSLVWKTIELRSFLGSLPWGLLLITCGRWVNDIRITAKEIPSQVFASPVLQSTESPSCFLCVPGQTDSGKSVDN